ncbi:MAG: hypothetical protein MJB57_10330 [Gemmatimonadetes bacterium]|nr:hypothetical protein [Gemmatimonadota bacterium]
MSRCDETRELLWPLGGPEEVGEREAEARAHLEGCEACRAFFRRDEALGSALQLDVSAPVSDELKERVARMLDQEATVIPLSTARRGSRRLGPWLAAAAALVIVVVGILRSGTDMDAVYADAYRERHVHMAVLDGPTGDQAYEFFMQELGTEMMPAVMGDAPVRRARICKIGDHSSAVVDYEMDGHTVAHYRLPAGAASAPSRVHVETDDGVCVVRWSDDRYDHALVADMPEQELLAVAEQQFAALR